MSYLINATFTQAASKNHRTDLFHGKSIIIDIFLSTNSSLTLQRKHLQLESDQSQEGVLIEP